MDAFENLKNSQSNFDKLTKQIEANLNPEDAAKTKKAAIRLSRGGMGALGC